MKWLIAAVSGILQAGFVATTLADISCSGTVQSALLYSDGSVNVNGSWRGDYTYFCNTSGTFGNIPSDVCLVWYATAVKAAAENKHLLLYYATTSYTCATLPTYGSAIAPVYVGLAP